MWKRDSRQRASSAGGATASCTRSRAACGACHPGGAGRAVQMRAKVRAVCRARACPCVHRGAFGVLHWRHDAQVWSRLGAMLTQQSCRAADTLCSASLLCCCWLPRHTDPAAQTRRRCGGRWRAGRAGAAAERAGAGRRRRRARLPPAQQVADGGGGAAARARRGGARAQAVRARRLAQRGRRARDQPLARRDRRRSVHARHAAGGHADRRVRWLPPY